MTGPEAAIPQAGDVGRVLFLAHSHAFGPFRVGSHHYARTLAHRRVEVVHLSTPLSLAHRATGRVSRAAAALTPTGPVRDGDGVTHVVPRTLLPRPYGQFRVAGELERRGIRTRFDAVLIDQPLLWDDSVRSLAPRLVYRPTDLYPSGTKHSLQRRILAASDGVVATSREVLLGLGRMEQPSLVLENGVDAARFGRPDDAAAPRPDVCVYVGALDGRFDWGRLDRWARAHASTRFVVAGPAAAPPIALAPNVDLVGAVAYDDLPSLLNGARVGLLPLSDDPLNAGRSPMKLYEYLASGLAVVARETPVIRADEQAGVFTYAGDGDADAALERALARSSPNTAGRRRASAEGWDAKTDALVSFLTALPSR